MTAQTYEAWRISHQSSEQAARAAFALMQELEAQTAQPQRAPLSDAQRQALDFCKARGRVSIACVQRELAISWRSAYDLCQSLVDHGGLVDELSISPALDQSGST